MRAAEIRAINQVSGIVSDIGETATRRRIHEADTFFKSEAWASYERELDKVVRLASIAPEKIREEIRTNEALLAARRAATEFGTELLSQPDANKTVNLERLAAAKGFPVKTTKPFDRVSGL